MAAAGSNNNNNNMNNWLGFSLSPQDEEENSTVSHHHHHDNLNNNNNFSSDDHHPISAAVAAASTDHHQSRFDNYHHLAAASNYSSDHHSTNINIIPSLNLNPAAAAAAAAASHVPHFALLEAFNTTNTHNHQYHSQDWNSTTTNFSCSSSHNNNSLDINQHEERPKLENFLGVGGGHSFSTSTTQDHQQQHNNLQHIYQTNHGNHHDNGSNFNMYQEISSSTTGDHQSMMNIGTAGNNNSSSTIGLSMIKNWLRTNPTPPHASEDQNKINDNEATGPSQGGGGAQTLSLSMSTGSSSQIISSSHFVPVLIPNNGNNNNNSVDTSSTAISPAVDSAVVPRKSADTFGQRTSIYRGVTRHRWTGRYEAHLWDNSCRREGQTRKGKQVYLGGYDKEDKAARSYDLAALKYWGTTTTTNFPVSNYEKEIEEMKHMTRLEFIASLRRKSSGFSRGASIYRGVTRHHQHGRWQARIGRVAGNKDLYLGTFSTQEEAAEAYDIAAIKFRGLNAVTNFEINRYDVKTILESATLPIGAAAKRLKDAENAEMALKMQRADEANLIEHGHMLNGWPTSIAFQQQQSQPLMMYPYQRMWCKQEQDPENGFNIINHQIQQLGNSQNFGQPSVLHNLMSLDSCSNPVVYGNGNSGSSFEVVQDEEKSQLGYHEGMFGLADARNLYYQQQQQAQQSASNCDYSWIPTAVPTPGARTFTVWNDT